MLDCIYNIPTVAWVKLLSLYQFQFSVISDTKRVLLLLSLKKDRYHNIIKHFETHFGILSRLVRAIIIGLNYYYTWIKFTNDLTNVRGFY